MTSAEHRHDDDAPRRPTVGTRPPTYRFAQLIGASSMTGTVPAPETTRATADKTLIPPSVTMNDGIRSDDVHGALQRADRGGHGDDGERGQRRRGRAATGRASTVDSEASAAIDRSMPPQRTTMRRPRGEHDERRGGVGHRGQAPLRQEARVGDGERDHERDQGDDRHERRHAGQPSVGPPLDGGVRRAAWS